VDEMTFYQNISGDNNTTVQGSGNIVTSIFHNIHPRTLDAVAAEQKLASLPLDIDPKVGDVPANSKLIFLPNDHFCGRVSELRILATLLKERDGKNVAITGIGGIGKTQLASHFVHCFGRYFEGGVFWLNFADENTARIEVANSCAALRSELPLVDINTLSLDERVQLIRTRWQEPLPRLLIFDNCEEEALYKQYRPPTGGCRVLITSRRAIWTAELGVEVLHLGELSPDESIVFLRLYLPGTPDADLRAVADELGHLPLALQLASHYLKAYHLTTAARIYAEELRKEKPLQHASLQGKGSTTSPTDHILHVEQTFAMSYRRLELTDPIDQLARILLKRAAYLAPGVPISYSLLFATPTRCATRS